MTDFATWLREWAAHTENAEHAVQFLDDLANLAAELHEALTACESRGLWLQYEETTAAYQDLVRGISAAEKFQEKYGAPTQRSGSSG